MQSNTEIKYVDSNGNNCSPLPIIETTITDANNLPKKNGFFKNSTGFTTNIPGFSSFPPYIVKQEVYTSGSTSYPVIIVQTTTSSTYEIYQRVAHIMGSIDNIDNPSAYMWGAWQKIYDYQHIYATTATTAQDYNTMSGTIKDKFNELAAKSLKVNYNETTEEVTFDFN